MKKIAIIRLIGIVSLIIPAIFFGWVKGFVFMIACSGYITVTLLAVILLILYFYSAISFIRGKFAIWKLAILIFGLHFLFLPFAIGRLSYFFSPYRQIDINKKTDDIEKYEENLTRLVKTRKNDPLIGILIGRLRSLHYGLGKYDLVLKSISEEERSRAEIVEVATYVKLGNISAAIDSCNKLINARPYRREKYYFLRGNVHYFFKEYEKAILDYSKAIEITTDPLVNNKSYLARGNAYVCLKEHDVALSNYNYVINSHLENYKADSERCSYLYGYFYRANFYFFLNKNEQAKDDLQYILTKSSLQSQVVVEANILMGYILGTEGKNDLALSYFKKAKKTSHFWCTSGNRGAKIRIHRTLYKLLSVHSPDDEDIKKFDGPLDKYSTKLEEIEDKIYLDISVLEDIPRLFDYNQKSIQ